MEFIEKVGYISVYTEKCQPLFEDDAMNVIFINGSDTIFKECYLNASQVHNSKLIEKAFRHLDILTLEWLYLNVKALEKVAERTYKMANSNDYFCKIDDTRYFKHVIDKGNLIKDKNGLTIIEY